MADESEMVERVARALAALSLNLNGNDAPIPHEPIIDRRWQNFVPQAHAAISAMRAALAAAIPLLGEGKPVGAIIDEDSYGPIAHFGGGLPPVGTLLYARPSALLARVPEVLEPLARLELPKRPEGNAGFYSIRHREIEAARTLRDEIEKELGR